MLLANKPKLDFFDIGKASVSFSYTCTLSSSGLHVRNRKN